MRVPLLPQNLANGVAPTASASPVALSVFSVAPLSSLRGHGGGKQRAELTAAGRRDSAPAPHLSPPSALMGERRAPLPPARAAATMGERPWRPSLPAAARARGGSRPAREGREKGVGGGAGQEAARGGSRQRRSSPAAARGGAAPGQGAAPGGSRAEDAGAHGLRKKIRERKK